MFGVPATAAMLLLKWLDTPTGQSTIEAEIHDFLSGLGIDPGPLG